MKEEEVVIQQSVVFNHEEKDSRNAAGMTAEEQEQFAEVFAKACLKLTQESTPCSTAAEELLNYAIKQGIAYKMLAVLLTHHVSEAIDAFIEFRHKEIMSTLRELLGNKFEYGEPDTDFEDGEPDTDNE